MLIVGLSLSLSLSLHRHPEGSAKAEGELVAQAKSIRSICTNQFTEPGSTITSHHTIHYSRFLFPNYILPWMWETQYQKLQ